MKCAYCGQIIEDEIINVNYWGKREPDPLGDERRFHLGCFTHRNRTLFGGKNPEGSPYNIKEATNA